MFWVWLLLGIGLLGGIIAWLGDNVGRRVGRKHLRLWGLRPKTTGLVFAIGSGVIVALATVGTVGLLARSTVNDAFRAQELRTQYNQVRNEFAGVQREYKNVKADLERLYVQSEIERQELGTAKAQLELKQNELQATTLFNGKLVTMVSKLETERNGLNTQIKTKAADLAKLGRESGARIERLRNELRRLETQRTQVDTKVRALNAQRGKLETRISDLDIEKRDLETRYRQAQNALQGAQNRQKLLENTVAVLANERSKLEGDIKSLAQTRSTLEASVNKLESQNVSLQKQLDVAQRDLQESQSALNDATNGNFIFRQDELVSQLVLESNNPEAVRNRIQEWLKQATQVANAKGAARNKVVVLKPSNDIQPFVEATSRSSGSDLILMRATRRVTQTGLELPVRLEVKTNESLFKAGQPIRARELAVGLPSGTRTISSWRVAIDSLLRDAERDLQARGVPKENMPVNLVSAAEVNIFLGQLEMFSGSAWIAVAARQEVTPAGPIYAYLTVMR